jgi:hypothetical protein
MSAPAGEGLQTCVANLCTCKHGTKTTASGGSEAAKCWTDGEEDCKACNSGYYISAVAAKGAQTCLPNVCECDNGAASVASGSAGTLCEQNNQKDCSECDAGYTLNGQAGAGPQICEANTCHNKSAVPRGIQYSNAACDAAVKTNLECILGCAPGYVGDDTHYTCSASGVLTRKGGPQPECKPASCYNKTGTDLFTGHHVSSDCADKNTHSNCTASCVTGYSGETQVYQCTADGYTGTPMKCEPDSCTVSPPANGGLGGCSSAVQSGKTCEITCNTGYSVVGIMQCLAGELTSQATCEPKKCDTSEAPAYGEVGDCPATLKSGGTCKPKCSAGYTANPQTSSCSKGALTATVCERNLKCNLVWTKTCEDNHGYWTSNPSYLNYEQCENWCNRKNQESGKKIWACELTGVTSSTRTATGGWCFAHVENCEIGTKSENAAAKCEQVYGGDANSAS